MQLVILLKIIEKVLIFLVNFFIQIDMNSFCRSLQQSFCWEFKKKKIVHLLLTKPLLSYYFFDEIIKFIRTHWNKRKYLFPGHVLIQPRLNQAIKFKFDHILIVKRRYVKHPLILRIYQTYFRTNSIKFKFDHILIVKRRYVKHPLILRIYQTYFTTNSIIRLRNYLVNIL